MKTPKRTCRDCLFFTSYSYSDPDGRCGEGCGTYGTHTRGSESACDAFMLSSAAKSARRKRKNRIAQLKRTITRILAGENLAPELQTAYRFMRLVMSKERRNSDELRFVQCLQLLAKHFSILAVEQMDSILNKRRKNAHKQAGSGQQTDLQPTVGQQACDAQNAENAKQETLLCAGAEQLETRKGN